MSSQWPDGTWNQAAAPTLRIGTPVISSEDDSIRHAVPLETPDGSETLWFEIERQYGSFLSRRADAAVVGLLLPAMRNGWNLLIEGPVTDELVFSLRHGVTSLLRHLDPTLHHVTVDAMAAAPPLPRSSGVATGFSGGIDSFCVVADFRPAPDIPPGWALTHLLYNNVGSHGRGQAGRRLFRTRVRDARKASSGLGLPLLMVDSNLDDFYGPGLDFSPTHTIRNASAAHVLQSGVGRFLYASSSPLDSTAVRPSYQMGIADPVLLPMISVAGLELRAVGGEYSRTAKTEIISCIPETWESLDVCVAPSGERNCSQCEKCLRTMVTLDVLGVLDRYKGVFDLTVYGTRREAFLAEILVGRRRDHREIRELARARGYRMPTRSRALAAAAVPGRAIRNLAWRLRNFGG